MPKYVQKPSWSGDSGVNTFSPLFLLFWMGKPNFGIFPRMFCRRRENNKAKVQRLGWCWISGSIVFVRNTGYPHQLPLPVRSFCTAHSHFCFRFYYSCRPRASVNEEMKGWKNTKNGLHLPLICHIFFLSAKSFCSNFAYCSSKYKPNAKFGIGFFRLAKTVCFSSKLASHKHHVSKYIYIIIIITAGLKWLSKFF